MKIRKGFILDKEVFDCVIIGAGPAGLSAALYAARDRFKTLVLEKFYPGGQINNTDRIENYPGFENISGPDLIEKMIGQVTKFGAQIKHGSEVTYLNKLKSDKIEIVCNGDVYTTRAVILASGSSYRKLGVPGEEKFRKAGAGVSYCGTCDAPFFKGKKIIAVGGGNVAVEDTLHLAKFASEVTLVHRRQEFRATRVLTEELMTKVNDAGSNLKLKPDTIVISINGGEKVESVTLKNVKTRAVEQLDCDGVFIFIGMVPNTEFLRGFVELSDNGFVKCDTAYLRTDVPGVFVAGDCRVGAAMQLGTSVGDGIFTAMMMKQYFRNPKWWTESVSDVLQPGGW
jgi:thioredoxin reductase (NADPH)